jgi:hypothetical protein
VVSNSTTERSENRLSAFEQRLLDQILAPPRRPRGVTLLGQRLTQPGHGARQLVQSERLGAGNLIGIQPGVAGPVGPRHHQAVQHAGEHRAFQREAEAPARGELLDHRGATGLLPQPAEDHWRANARGGGGLERTSLQAGDQQGGLGEPRTRAQQGIELSGGLEIFDTAEGGDDALARRGYSPRSASSGALRRA